MITDIFIVLALIAACGAAVKAGELLVNRGVRGFRGIRRLGLALGTIYEISEDFRRNGETLRDTIDQINLQVNNLTQQTELITLGCPGVKKERLAADHGTAGQPPYPRP